MTEIITELYDVIEDRRDGDYPESHTASLLEEEDAPLEKFGEEATEVMLAAKDGDEDGIVHESADVIYHLLVVMAAHDVDVEEVLEELRSRRG